MAKFKDFGRKDCNHLGSNLLFGGEYEDRKLENNNRMQRFREIGLGRFNASLRRDGTECMVLATCAILVAVTRLFNVLLELGPVVPDHAVLPGSR